MRIKPPNHGKAVSKLGGHGACEQGRHNLSLYLRSVIGALTVCLFEGLILAGLCGWDGGKFESYSVRKLQDGFLSSRPECVLSLI